MTSPRTISRLSRILALIPYVLNREGAEVSEILERFGYTEAQLAKDLDTVFVCGLPGYGPGDLMEAYIDENAVVIDAADYFARAPQLTSTEAISLLAAGMAIITSGQAPKALESAVAKLQKAIVPESSGALDIDVSGDSSLLGVLRQAAADRKVVRIRYRSLSREEETVREVEPWNVFTTLGNWYMQGHCRMAGGERVFRVDRIRDCGVLNETFERPTSVPDPGVGYTPSDADVVCEIWLGPRASWVPDYYPVEIIKQDGQGTHVKFSSPDVELPARLLLRLGESGRLVIGNEVARRVREIGNAVIARYQ